MANWVESPLFILLVVVLVVVLPLTWLLHRRRARRRKERELSELFTRPYSGPTVFSFRFESTHRDLLDAYAAQQFSVSGLSPLERALVNALGFFWLGCVIRFGPSAIREGRWWRLLVLLCLGSSVLWKCLLAPALTRRRIRQTNPPVQPLVLQLSDSGLHIEAQGMGVFERAWEELVWVELAEKGIAVVFLDGVTNWLPNRLFGDENERRLCAAYLMSKLPRENPEVVEET